MPPGDRRGTLGQMLQIKRAVLGGNGVPGAIGDQNIADHGIVDIAAQNHRPGGFESHRRRFGAMEKSQFEGLGRRKGIDVVADIIPIGEADFGACGNYQHTRLELKIDLVHRSGQRRSWRDTFNHDDGILERTSLLIKYRQGCSHRGPAGQTQKQGPGHGRIRR